MKFETLVTKLESFIGKRCWRRLIYTFGFLIIAGVAADQTPWARGWFHDLRWLVKMRHDVDWSNLAAPDFDYIGACESINIENDSPLMKEYRNEVEAWYRESLKRYPILQVQYKNVPDEQNGFLRIIEWIEEGGGELTSPPPLESVPDHLLELIDPKSGAVFDDHIHDIEKYLKTKQDILDRAMSIGLLEQQSVVGILPHRYHFMPIAWFKKITDHLKLKAVLELKRGDTTAGYETLKAIKGWGNHLGNVEVPSLIQSTLARAIVMGIGPIIYLNDQSYLADSTILYAQWLELMKSEKNLKRSKEQMFRGEWHHFITSFSPLIIPSYNPRDLTSLLDAQRDFFVKVISSDISIDGKFVEPPSPRGLTMKSKYIYDLLFIGIAAYERGMIRSQAIERQYEVAFMLRRMEAEGVNLKALDKKTIDALPLQILPDFRLSIDFEKRMISDPTGKIQNFEPLAF